MIEKLVELALKQRFLVIVLTLIVIGLGIKSMTELPIDAFPDVSPVQVQIFTEAEGLSAVEVEKLISFPLEVAMNGLPGITEIRSLSKFGLSVVSIYFRDDVDVYFARQLVFERVQQAREQIPEGLGDPVMGPITTGLGQIYQYALLDETGKRDVMELRTIQDWMVKFLLRTVPGVTDVLTFGGLVKQYHVKVDPDKLISYGVTLHDVFEAVQENNANAGGQFIVKGAEEIIVRGVGWIRPGEKAIEDLGNVVVAEHEGTPIYVRQIAEVTEGPEIRRGVVSMNGKGEIVSGIVLKLIGENSSKVIASVQEKVKDINESLPAGVRVTPYYDQADLVHKCVATVTKALKEGGLLVVAVLALFLWNVRSALIVTLTLPVSVLVAFILMRMQGLSANLMSLGGLAIGIGMMVDGSVVMVENIYRHLTERRNHRGVEQTVLEASREVARPVFFAVLIIIVVFLPLFTLSGVEGKLFTPMAYTITFALAGSLVLALTLVPALCVLLLRRRLSERESPVMRLLKPGYERLLRFALDHRGIVLAAAVVALAGSFALVPRLGSEFVPELDEGTIAIRVTFLPSVALEEAARVATSLEKQLLEFPEVKDAIGRTGRAELGGDPEPVSNSEIYVMLNPRKDWTVASKEELVQAMNAKLSQTPGILLSFTQPIAMRVDELLSGYRAQIAIKLFGEELDVLRQKAEEIRAAVSEVRGVADLQVEQTTGSPQLNIVIDRGAIARYGINVADVQDIVRTAIGGQVATEVLEGQRRFGVLVRFREDARRTLEAIREIRVPSPNGQYLPLAQLATISVDEGPFQITRENAMRVIAVQCNVRGRDMGGWVEEARRVVEAQVDLPPGYFVEWGGQFELQQRANARLRIVVPATVFLIFILLFSSFNSMRNAALIILNVPFALIGGILGLWVRGLNLSVPASVGFIALFGVAVLNGVVMVAVFNQLREQGLPVREAVLRGAVTRLRPVLMTALVAAFGLIPLMFSAGTGSEVQKPLATVVVGGLVSSTLLTLLVLPALYGWFEEKRPEVEV